MNLRKALATTLAIPILPLAACSNNDEPPTPESANTPSTSASKPIVHQLNETVTVGHTVTISDIKLSTEGCNLEGKDPNKFIKFQMIATVENGTQQEIQEILWPSDFRYKDSKGMTTTNRDNSDINPCPTKELSEFNDMGSGEKRRASITLVAPKDTVEMTYKTDLIPNAEPVTWSMEKEIQRLKSESPAPLTATESTQSDPTTPSSSVANKTSEPYVVECLFGTPGPSRMSDGTIRSTDFCANQPGADAYREAERNAGLPPSKPPSTNHETCPAYKCGYGTSPDGAPNKTSGQLQFEDGCRNGYIDRQRYTAAGVR